MLICKLRVDSILIHDSSGCNTSPVPSSSSLATLALFLKSFLFCWSIALLAWVASSEAQFPMAAVAGAAAGLRGQRSLVRSCLGGACIACIVSELIFGIIGFFSAHCPCFSPFLCDVIHAPPSSPWWVLVLVRLAEPSYIMCAIKSAACRWSGFIKSGSSM